MRGNFACSSEITCHRHGARSLLAIANESGCCHSGRNVVDAVVAGGCHGTGLVGTGVGGTGVGGTGVGGTGVGGTGVGGTGVGALVGTRDG